MPVSWLMRIAYAAWHLVVLAHPPHATATMPQRPCPLLQYGERLPIGKESVINGVPASVVKGFYERWYRPEVRPGVSLHLQALARPGAEACVCVAASLQLT